jgi:hypothetical protein
MKSSISSGVFNELSRKPMKATKLTPTTSTAWQKYLTL